LESGIPEKAAPAEEIPPIGLPEKPVSQRESEGYPLPHDWDEHQPAGDFPRMTPPTTHQP